MITIAPPELCSGLTPGQTVNLGELITRADIRDCIPKPRGGPRGDSHPIPQPCLILKTIKTGKYYYQSCCWTAMGKCDRCRAPECTDRDWRELRREVP